MKIIKRLIKMHKDLSYPYLLLFVAVIVIGGGPSVYAQNNMTVEGTVTDASTGNTLPGVNIAVKGTTTGTATDSQGQYELTVENLQDTLVFSFVGYQTRQVPIGGRNEINIKMVPKAISGKEMVVIGYGTQSREEVTTSISKVDSTILNDVPFDNAEKALQGTVPGVRVQQTTGQPGTEPTIVIRGGTSINNPNGASPLYVIDGVIRPNMEGVATDDIESIQVLKDAASTSIYGARGSNGVVIVKTKSGKPGETQISYDSNLIISQVGKTYDMVSARNFIKLYRLAVVASAKQAPKRISLLERATPGGTGNNLNRNTGYTTQYLTPENKYKLDEGWESMPDPVDPSKTIIFKDTNWQDVLFRTGVGHKQHLNVSGGSENATFNLGLGYLSNRGTAVDTYHKRLSLNFSGNLNVSKNLTATGRIMYAKGNHRGEGWNYERGQLIAPTAKYKYEDGSPARPVNSNYRNPEYYNNSRNLKNTDNDLTIAVGGTWDILPGLSFNPRASIYRTSSNDRTFQKAGYINSPTNYNDSRKANASFSEQIRYQGDALLSYKKSFNDTHNISFKGGFEYYKNVNNALSAEGQNAATDLIPTLNASAEPVSVYGFESSRVLLGYFSRIKYNYKQKYLLSLNGRYDGSSNLGANYRWGFFPSISGGWIISKENFWSNFQTFVNQLKLRASYGVTGNISGLGDFQSQGEFSVNKKYEGNPAIINTILPNPNLKWERSRTLNIGIDVGLFGNRVNITSDFYRRVTDNLLTSRSLPASTGFSSIITNLGSLENKGVDLELSANILPSSSNFQWNFSTNASYVKNKILKLPDNGAKNNRVGGLYLWNSSKNKYTWQGGLQEGHTMGNLYGYQFVKVYATDEEAASDPVVDMVASASKKEKYGGDAKWRDFDSNGIIDSRDQQYMGNIYPNWTGGVSNYFSYKNITLGIRMDYALGHTIFNWAFARDLGLYGTRAGFVKEALKSWQKPGDVTDVPKIYWADQNHQRNFDRTGHGLTRNGNGSSQFFEPGNYLALRELSLSYSLPQEVLQKIGITKLRLNITGSNLHYFTKFRGLSPEVGGTNYGTYPIPKKIIFGVNISL